MFMTPMFEVPEWVKGPLDETADFHYEIEVTPRQWLALLDILFDRKRPPVKVTKSIIEAVVDSRRINTTLIRDKLNWAEIEGEAKRQGCSAADLIWDRAKGKGD